MENPLKTNSVRLLGAVDAIKLEAIREKVSQISPDLWDAESRHKPNKFAVLGKTQHVIFKFVDGLDTHLHYHEKPLWKIWSAPIQPLLEEVAAALGYEQAHFPRVMLAKMPPHTKISKHVDAAPAAQYPHKIHVPLETNQDAFFCHEQGQYHFEVGHAYEVNNNITHWVDNDGDTARIHLIFECFGS